MAWTDLIPLPFTQTRLYDAIASSAAEGVIIRRSRFPSPEAPRMFRVEIRNAKQADLVDFVAAVDAVKGAAVDFAITLPDVGTAQVRFDDDGYEYQAEKGQLKSFAVNLIEEPRV